MLRLFVRLVALVLRLVVHPFRLLRRSRAALPSGWIALELTGAVEDIAPPRRFWERRRRPSVSLHALDELARAIAKDPRARGLVVTIRDARFGMATATSLRSILARVREAGRAVVVYLPYGGATKECFVAFAGNQVLVGPQATLSPVGFAVTTPYLQKALAKLGVVPEVLARGRYKSAGESLVRDSMSEAQREQLGALVDGFYGALVSAIATGRGTDEAKAKELVDRAPFMGAEAVAAGLADAALYDDGMLDRVVPSGPKTLVPAARYLARRRLRLGPLRDVGAIGVIRVHGAIVQSGGAPWMTATDERVVSAIRRARESKRVLGVVLHIDSPGGSALASDRMHHELVRLAKEKPLVACMANVAASGGYYVAAAAHAIVAQPTTITGSIGVVSARLAVDPLLARIGVSTEVVKRGAHADLLQPTRQLTPEEREVLDREIEIVYRAFVGVVAEGRKKTFDEIDALAQGRVWSGIDAHARGLVDELGGFDRALDLVRARIGKGGESAEPVVVLSSRGRVSQEERDLGRAAAAFGWLAGDGASLAMVALARPRERVLMWADLGDLA
jgi:protease IV